MKHSYFLLALLSVACTTAQTPEQALVQRQAYCAAKATACALDEGLTGNAAVAKQAYCTTNIICAPATPASAAK